MRLLLPAVIVATIVVSLEGCGQTPQPAESTDEKHLRGTRPLPPIGLSVADELRNWCAAFVKTPDMPSFETGRRVTLVFAEGTVTLNTTIAGAQEERCPAAFPQPRWIDYQAYRLTLDDAAAVTATVALAVVSDAQWTRAPNGRPHADLERDGTPEELITCAADEGEHFTVWSVEPSGGARRRWHEYYDWGALVDPTCKPGEDGR